MSSPSPSSPVREPSALVSVAPAVLLVLLAWVGGASGLRLWDLATEGWRPRAPGEERWLGWGAGNTWERTALARLPDRPPVPPRGEFRLRVVTRGPVRTDWTHVQAQYRWPTRRVLEVTVARPGDPLPSPWSEGGTPVLEVTVEEPDPSLAVTSNGEGPGELGEAGDPPATASRLLGLALLLCALVGGRALVRGSAARQPAHRAPGTGAVSRRITEGVGSLVLGFGLLAAGVLVIARLLPATTPSPQLAAPLLAGLVLLALALAAGRWRERRSPGVGEGSSGAATESSKTSRGEGGWQSAGLRLWGHPLLERAADGALVLAVAAFLWQTLDAPLWSWDHHAIWGLKARRLAALGAEAGLFESSAFRWTAGHYPLGWPALVWVLTPGGCPGTEIFRALHLGAGLALVILLRFGSRVLGLPALAASTAAALVASSPLLWDSEALGLADLPLALLATTAGILGLRALVEPRRRLLVATGLVVGMLPWVKQEGWVLAVAVAMGWAMAAGVSAGRRPKWLRRRARSLPWLLAPAALLALAHPLAHRPLARPGLSFLAGDWVGRWSERLGRMGEIGAALGEVLADPSWHGLWWVFAAAVGVLGAGAPWLMVRSRRWWARARRRNGIGAWMAPPLGPMAFLVAMPVLLQLAAYAFVYLATYLPPLQHVASSFLRIAGALGPLAALFVARVFAGSAREGEAPPLDKLPSTPEARVTEARAVRRSHE